MSVKVSKRLSSKKKNPLKDNAQAEVLYKLGLEAFWTKPLDPASMLDISTWNLETQAPVEPKDLPSTFLQRLWLLSPDARNPHYKPQHEVLNDASKPLEETVNGFEVKSQFEISPLDLVSAVFTSANTFLQHEIIVRMVQCRFAVPLVLPNIDPDEPSHYLLWPLRNVFGQWRSHPLDRNMRVQEGDLASTHMPVVSCVKLGRCGISKSKVLNHVIGGETFLHRGMDGGQLPRRLSNGLVEIGWYLPNGDAARDIFPIPVVFSNLRGDASTHEKNFSLLCQASSAVVVFCGDLREKEKLLLATYKHTSSKLILIDLSDIEDNGNRVVGFADQNLGVSLGLPEGSVLRGNDLTEEELSGRLSDTLKDLLPNQLKPVTLEATAKIAEELGLSVDEGAACKKAMAKVEEVLNGLEEGSVKFKSEQLPLQGALWSKLGKIEKQEKKLRKNGQNIDFHQQQDKKDILVALSSYKMTPAMKVFTDVLFTSNKVERSCFLTWMKLKLSQLQNEKPIIQQHLSTELQLERIDDLPDHPGEIRNGDNDTLDDSDSFCTDSTFDDEEETEEELANESQVSGQQTESSQDLGQESTEKTSEPQSEQSDPDFKNDPIIEQQVLNKESEELNEDHFDEELSDPNPMVPNSFLQSRETEGPEDQSDHLEAMLAESGSGTDVSFQAVECEPFERDPTRLGLEHFLREMGLIFELTHISPGSGSHNVLRLPSLAVDLLLYGVPLELMDGDASNIPVRWLACIFAELKRRLPQDRGRTRVLTSLGVHHAGNAEILSALFGVKFPAGRRRSTKGLYMTALCLPDYLREDMECDFLFLIDAEGLCAEVQDKKGLIHDNEMASVATGLSDVLLHNISSYANTDFETNFTVIANALLRIKESDTIPFPICQLLAQDEGINSTLQTSQLKRVSEMLQHEIVDQGTNNIEHHTEKTPSSIIYVKGPWNNIPQSADTHYSEAVLKLKLNLLGALKRCVAKSKANGLPEFFNRLSAVWDDVRAESFSIGMQNTEIALAFSFLCTELSQWEDRFLEHMEYWLMEVKKKIFTTKEKVLDAAVQNELLDELKGEAREEIKAEVDKLRSKVDSYLMRDDLLKMYPFKPILMSNLDELQGQVTEQIEQRLETVTESHCSSTQLERLEAVLEKEQHSKLQGLLENSRSTKVLLDDKDLEEEFESLWTKTLSSFDFRPSEMDDITARVADILRENLMNHGLQKHIKKIEDIGKNPASSFTVYDEHFGYRSRLKHMFEDNNRLQRLEAQKLASNIIEEYNQFVEAKSSLMVDFSNSYITELLENIEKSLMEKSMEIRSAFEVDLKVYLCSCACRDFQGLHDRYAKDTELLTCFIADKSRYVAQFIYLFRKRDECQRMAEAFTSMVLKPTAMNYIYGPLGKQIVEDIRQSAPQFHSPHGFHKCLLEELLQKDRFEDFLEYLDSYNTFSMKRIQETVLAHLSDTTNLNKWRQNRLGEIVGKIAAAISKTLEGTSGVLCDTKVLLESVCLTLEKDGDVEVQRSSLDGPLFSITTEWDRFVKHLMELLAAMRLDLAQEFSQNMDANQLLQHLPTTPQDLLYKRVRGCEKRCPLCRAPCDLTEMEHEVHMALLHRPKGIGPNHSSSLSCMSCPGSMAEENAGQREGINSMTMVQGSTRNPQSLYPHWSFPPEDQSSQMSCTYWRYVLVRFNEKFAQEYEQEPAEIPEDWTRITNEEALDSLKEAFRPAQT